MRSPTNTGRRNSNELTATVTTRPLARRKATMLAAMSTCAMIQPPKMAPAAVVSVGMARTRRVGARPCGRQELFMVISCRSMSVIKPCDVVFMPFQDGRAPRLEGRREQAILHRPRRQAQGQPPHQRREKRPAFADDQHLFK